MPLSLLANLQADSSGGRPLVVVHNASHGSALEAYVRADAEARALACGAVARRATLHACLRGCAAAPPRRHIELLLLPTRRSRPYTRKCKH